MGFVVLHIDKATGNDVAMTAHIERVIDPENADKERSHLNRELVEFPDGVENRTAAIGHRLDNAGLSRKIGTNQVRALRIMLSGTPEDMQRIEQAGRLDWWCEDNLAWLRKTYGADNVVSAVLHMDEKTPHIHATVVPIVTGERRKAQTKPTEPGKKKYRTRSVNAPRLCADDVMARPRLKTYQDTYAAAMSKYGLQRGIDGSEARHITNRQFYRDLKIEKDGLQQDIRELKSELRAERFKSSAAEVGTTLINTVGSLLGSSKIERQKQEIEALKTENQTLRQEVAGLSQTLNRERKEHEKTVSDLKSELAKIYDWLPDTPHLVKWGEYCRHIGFSNAQAKELINLHSVRFSGELYSTEHHQRFNARNAEVRLDKTAGGFRLLINGAGIAHWFRQKKQEFLKAVGINIKDRQHQTRNIIKQ